MYIKIDDLNGTEIRELLEEHRRSMFLHSPPENVFALDIEGLKKPELHSGVYGKIMSCWAAERLKNWMHNMPKSNPCEQHLNT